MWPRAKRWLYRGNRPGAVARLVNRAVSWLHASGFGPATWVTLEVVGRKTGRPIAFPLVMTQYEGERYFVSMLGTDAAWVGNLIAAGGCARIRRRGVESVRLEAVDDDRKAPILRAYLSGAPGARPHVPIAVDAPLADFERAAPDFPVFRVRSGPS